MARLIKLYKLPEEPLTPGIRPLTKKDIPQVTATNVSTVLTAMAGAGLACSAGSGRVPILVQIVQPGHDQHFCQIDEI